MIITVPTLIVNGKEENDIISGDIKFVVKERVMGTFTFSLKNLISWVHAPFEDESGIILQFKNGYTQNCNMSIEEFELLLYDTINKWFDKLDISDIDIETGLINDVTYIETTVYEWFLFLNEKYGIKVEGYNSEDSR